MLAPGVTLVLSVCMDNIMTTICPFVFAHKLVQCQVELYPEHI